jgi:predicted acetyltransferase
MNASMGIDLPPGIVPMTSFWLVEDDQTVIGESRLRHRLTPALEIEGGHIGYAIRPSARRKGYGTRILALTLERARVMGLRQVLVTCNTDNIASARIIEKNGGLLDGYALSPHSRVQISRYWISINTG